MTTILAEPTTTVTSVPGVLYTAAHHLQTLRHTRVGWTEIHHALIAAGPTVGQAQQALDALHAHLPTGDATSKRWTWRIHRTDAAALLTRAADMMQPPAVRAARVADVLQKAARYVAQPVNASLPDALRTATRDDLLVGEAVEALARRLRCHPRDIPMWDRSRSRAQVGGALADAALLAERAAAAVTR